MSSVIQLGYKWTEVGIIPNDWKVVSLGEIGSCLIGLTYSPSNVKNHGTLVLRSSNIQNGTLTLEDNVYVDSAIPERIVVQDGDILICVRNGSRRLIGKCALLDQRVAGQTFGAFMSVFRTSDSAFVFHQFQSNLIKRQIDENIGATINQITNANLNAFKIPFPTDPQERITIARAMSDVDTLINSLDQLITKKRNIQQATMQYLLTGQRRLPGFSGAWDVKPMRALGNTYGGLAGKTKIDFGHGEARYIPFMNVMTDTVIDASWLEPVDVAPDEAQNLAKKGDLFFNGSSETPEEVGFCSVLLEEIPNLYLNSFCFGFRFNTTAKVNGLFFAYWFRSKAGRAAMSVLAQGATRYNIAKSAFMQLEIPQPSEEEQTAIATVLSDMGAELAALEARRDKASQIKQGMMQELLTGKIRLLSNN